MGRFINQGDLRLFMSNSEMEVREPVLLVFRPEYREAGRPAVVETDLPEGHYQPHDEDGRYIDREHAIALGALDFDEGGPIQIVLGARTQTLSGVLETLRIGAIQLAKRMDYRYAVIQDLTFFLARGFLS